MSDLVISKLSQVRMADTAWQLDDGNTYTSSDQSQVSSADAKIDFGSDADNRPQSAIVFLTVTSTDDGDADETYNVKVECSDSATFASGNTTVFSRDITRGDADDLEMLCQVTNRYMRIYYTLGGTTPSLVVAHAYATAGLQ